MDSVERESCFSLRPTVAGVQMQRSQLQVQEHRKVFQRKDKHNVLPFFRSVTEVVHGYLAVYGTPKGLSSVQLSKDIGVTQKTAWAMLHRIRKCFGEQNKELVLDGTVEIDETFIGGKNKNRHKDKKVKHSKGRSFKDKVPVFGMLQRGGNVVAKVVANTRAKTLRKEINKTIVEGSTVYSDEWNYGNLSRKYNHSYINHCYGVYGIGEVTTNSIEGFWSILKRGIIGVYHKVSKWHLQNMWTSLFSGTTKDCYLCKSSSELQWNV